MPDYATHARAVPDFEVLELHPRHGEYCVLIFVMNEGQRVRKQLAAMERLARKIDVVIADGGSTDGSLDEASLRQWGVRVLLTKKGAGKLSAQMRMAFAWALDEGYNGVICIDGNGKDDPSAIPEFIRLLEAGFDHIQGSRFIPGGRGVNTPLSRYLGVRLLHSPLISLAARHRHTDTTNGFRAYSARLLADDRISVFRQVFDTYELHYHLATESARERRFRLIETPVTRTYPKHGKTPTKISPIAGNVHMLLLLGQAVRRRWRTQP